MSKIIAFLIWLAGDNSFLSTSSVILNLKSIINGLTILPFITYDSFLNLQAKDIMSPTPKIIEADSLAIEALEQMKQNNISQLVVINKGSYNGIVHLHDLIREGII